MKTLGIDRDQLAKDTARVTYNRLLPRHGQLAEPAAAELERATRTLGISRKQLAEDVGASQSETARSGGAALI